MVGILFLLSVVVNQNALPSGLPSSEVTQARYNALNEKMLEIKEKTEKLNLVSVRLEVQGENAPVETFVEDSLFVLKLRADILCQLVDIFEEALDARYKLEATLDDYNNWIKKSMGDVSARNQKFEVKANSLEKENSILLDEATIITNILATKLESYVGTLKDKKMVLLDKIDSELDSAKLAVLKSDLMKLESSKTKYEISLLEKTSALKDKKNNKISLSTIENRNEIEKKYDIPNGSDPELAIQQLESKLEDIKQRYSSKRYEISILKKDFLKPDGIYLNKLKAEQKKLLSLSDTLLLNTKDYPYRAQKIYIASKYLKIMIDEADKAGGDVSNIAVALDKVNTNEKFILKALEAATGQADVVEDLRDLINKRFESNKEASDKQIKIDKDEDKEKKELIIDKLK